MPAPRGRRWRERVGWALSSAVLDTLVEAFFFLLFLIILLGSAPRRRDVEDAPDDDADADAEGESEQGMGDEEWVSVDAVADEGDRYEADEDDDADADADANDVGAGIRLLPTRSVAERPSLPFTFFRSEVIARCSGSRE
jgi:hypothetical protein